MKNRTPILAIAFIFLASLPVTAQELGDKIYKEVTVDGELLYKWVEYSTIAEYDENENLIQRIGSSGMKMWCEYDSKGNRIYEFFDNSISWLGYYNTVEWWYEYDTKGNMIHRKSSSGVELWNEYDTQGNMIHAKSASGTEWWYEYDSKGYPIHSKRSDGSEEWYEYTHHPNGKIKTKKSYGAI